MIEAPSFNSRGLTKSGPDDLLIFRVERLSFTSCSVITIAEKLISIRLCEFGSGLSGYLTLDWLAKYSLRMFALSVSDSNIWLLQRYGRMAS